MTFESCFFYFLKNSACIIAVLSLTSYDLVFSHLGIVFLFDFVEKG